MKLNECNDVVNFVSNQLMFWSGDVAEKNLLSASLNAFFLCR